jgi:murein DD-endopeptidase MepM/ murein hydrolase activator NlpD
MNRGEKFDRIDFALPGARDDGEDGDDGAGDEDGDDVLVVPPGMASDLSVLSGRWAWPIDPRGIKRLGDSVTDSRPGKHRPHQGLDIYANAGARVYAAASGQVLRVVDGRKSENKAQRRAGLFVDILTAPDGNGSRWIHRYLHLGTVRALVKAQQVAAGDPIGEVAQPHTSGLAAEPHLHFEAREMQADRSYGQPVDPRGYFPPLTERT